MWILGGLGKKSLLKTTEIVTRQKSGKWRIRPGPKLPKAMFSHCAVALPNGKVVVAGGVVNECQHLKASYEWDPAAREWAVRDFSKMAVARIDHICLTDSHGNAYAVGGWNTGRDKPNVTEKYVENERSWETLPDTADAALPDIHRSSGLGLSGDKKALIGGVSCKVFPFCLLLCAIL